MYQYQGWLSLRTSKNSNLKKYTILCQKNGIGTVSLNEGVFTHIFLNEQICNEFDDRFCTKLREKLSASENTAQVDFDRIPCYQKIVDLIDDGTVSVEKNESNDFQKTCAFFNLLELQQYTEIYFIEGIFSTFHTPLN